MRLVNKIFIDDINISVFDLDLKYVLKFEFRGLNKHIKSINLNSSIFLN
ncbi:MAG: hypothetical protein Ct9H90mP3_1110 [Flammeovirgaceae bacterium]|nr:MAG: hypothetical protein Ct9H90mP3_1110 [Flammeovirgaceae bacterium]